MDPEAIQLLREIRDESRQTNTRLDQANARLEVVETTALELAEQQRFVVRYLRSLSERDRTLDDDLHELRRRVDEIEARLGPA